MERLLQDAHALARDWWDPSLRLLSHPGGDADASVLDAGTQGLLAPTVWWAYGLLRRGDAGDRELAEVALQGALERQLDASGNRQGRDATGRVEMGVALALVLRDHAVPATLATDVRRAVERAVRADAGRQVDTTWTSEAVQRAWLELEVGRWLGDEELLRVGGERAQAVAADAGVRGHVAEHVGPTITGVTLLGLSLWAERPPVADLAPLGRALRDEVWHDLLAVWHPGLRTLVPPFTRADAMDLRSHVGATGLWLAWLVDGVDPLPPLYEPPLRHAQDLPMVFPVDALAGASDDVRALAPLVRAQPARQGEWFDRVGERVWTGWTGADLVVGAEWSPVDWGGRLDVVTTAAVWQADDGTNAWLRLHQDGGPVEARVEREADRVRLVHGTTSGPVELWVGGHDGAVATADRVTHGGRTWELQGVADLVPVARQAPGLDTALRLVPTADGVVLTTSG